MVLLPSPFGTKLSCEAKLVSGVEDESNRLYLWNQGLDAKLIPIPEN